MNGSMRFLGRAPNLLVYAFRQTQRNNLLCHVLTRFLLPFALSQFYSSPNATRNAASVSCQASGPAKPWMKPA